VGFWIIILVLCLLPLERWIFPLNLKVVDAALVLLILYSFVRAWLVHGHVYLPLLGPIWLVLMASLFATLTGLQHSNSTVAIVQELYLYIWFVGLTNLLATMPLLVIDKLLKFWSVIAVVEATTTVLGMLRIGPSMFYVSSYSGRILASGSYARALGTYVNPNAAASYLSISFFVVWAARWPVWVRLVLSVWILAGIFATGSLGALSSTLISFAMLGVLYYGLKQRRATGLMGAAISLGLGLIMVVLLLLGVWSSFSSGSESIAENELLSLTVGRIGRAASSRSALIESNMSVYSHYPLGTGPNTSTLYIGSLHNDYVAFLFERGPLGVVGWLWLVGATLIVPLRAIRRQTDRFRRWQALSLGAGFLACAINALSHEVSHFRQVWVLIAFIFALGYILSADEKAA
jgi:hypothetical protein